MKKRRKQSLQEKLALAFAVIIICIMAITLTLHARTLNMVRQMAYEKMNSQAEYYQQTFETELQGILNLQLEFFNNRKLPFLANPVVGLNAYEEREAVLNVQERIRTITGVSSLIKSGILYIPKNHYYITDATIRRMTKEDFEDMEAYLHNEGNSLPFDGENFYCARTGETGQVVAKDPDFVFVLIFSGKQVEEKLSVLNTSDKGGAFIYNEDKDIMLESSFMEGMGEKIWERLKRDEQGDVINVQRIRVEGEDYLVLAGGTGVMGSFVQYVEESSITGYVTRSWGYMTVFLLVMIGISVVFIIYTRRIVHNPLNRLVQAFERVKEGKLDEHIYHGTNDEFSYLYQAFNDMEDRLSRLIEEVYVQKNLTQKAQLKQLQAQINPHFLYNSFFTLSRRIKRQDYDNAEEFARHLGNYFKYLTRDGSDFIALRQEVEHAKSYAAIQQARFSSRVRVCFEQLPDSCSGLMVPRLILQPLLENSFGHGLENKVCDGILKVGFQVQNGCLRILVEDNGEEASDEDIGRMREALWEQEPDEVTGIVNIHRRLKNYFQGPKGAHAGLLIERSSLGGVLVIIEICTPEITAGEAGQEKCHCEEAEGELQKERGGSV